MKGQVYLLTSIETGMGYVGSTINLDERLRLHRNEKYNACKSKLLGRFTYLILEEYVDDNTTDKDEFLIKLELVERKWQDLYWGNLVNKYRSRVTRKERLEQNKEYFAKYPEYRAKYQALHSEQIKECKAKYRAEHSEQLNEKFNCECGGKFTQSNKSIHFKTKKHQEYIATNLPITS